MSIYFKMNKFEYPDAIWIFTMLGYFSLGLMCVLIYMWQRPRIAPVNNKRKKKIAKNKNNQTPKTAKLPSELHSKNIINSIWLGTISYCKRNISRDSAESGKGLVKRSERDLSHHQNNKKKPGKNVVCKKILQPTTRQVKIKEVELFTDDSKVRELDINVTSQQQADFEHKIISTVETLTDEMCTEEGEETQLVVMADYFKNTEQVEITQKENGVESEKNTYLPSQIVVKLPNESFVWGEMIEPTISQIEVKEVELFIEDPSFRELDISVIATTSEEQVGLEPEIISTVDILTNEFSHLKLKHKIYTEEGEETQLVIIADNLKNIEQVEITQIENGEESEQNAYFPSQIVLRELNESLVREEILEPTTSRVEIEEGGNSSDREIDTIATAVSSEEHVGFEHEVISTTESAFEVNEYDRSMPFADIEFRTKKEKGRKKIRVENTVELSSELTEDLNQTTEVRNQTTEALDQMTEILNQVGFEHEIISTTESAFEVNEYDRPMPFADIEFRTKKKKGRKKNRVENTVELPSEQTEDLNQTTEVRNQTTEALDQMTENLNETTESLNQTTEVDFDSAHSVDNSINAPNTVHSDIRSEGSQDSGRGGSSLSGHPALSEIDTEKSYEIVIPIHLAGLMIGRRGSFIKFIRRQTNAKLAVLNDTRFISDDRFKTFTLVGSETNVNRALKLIRIRFPNNGQLIIPQIMPKLIRGINNSVFIANLIAIDHFYVHNKSDSDFENLTNLNIAMNNTYRCGGVLLDLRTITRDTIVAAYSEGNWYRAKVIDIDYINYEYANVFLLDYGGYKTIANCDIRPINVLLMSLKFQAINCSLANIAPTSGNWCSESQKLFKTLTAGKMMYAQVIFRTPSVDFINLLAIDHLGTFSINAELIKAGFAVHCNPNAYPQFNNTRI